MVTLDQAVKQPDKEISDCCKSDMIPPDWEMAERMGSLWMAYAVYICKGCGKVCNAVNEQTPVDKNKK